MATVYLAEDLKHHRKVAIKVLHPELAALLGADRFLREIKITANLQHPHILPLFDSGVATLRHSERSEDRVASARVSLLRHALRRRREPARPPRPRGRIAVADALRMTIEARPRPRRRPPPGHPPPRHQAGEHPAARRRAGHRRLRHRPRHARERRPAHRGRHLRRHRALHEPGAGHAASGTSTAAATSTRWPACCTRWSWARRRTEAPPPAT